MELMIVVVILGILAAIAIPNFRSFVDRARDATVKENCHLTQLAAEDFGVRNGGFYPASTADAGVDGETLIDLLPGAARFENPWTQVATEPIDGAAGTMGQTGYIPVALGGASIGYRIEGMGRVVMVAVLINGTP